MNEHIEKRLKKINVFLTPLAALLIIFAVLISNADAISATIGLFLVLFSIFFNNVALTNDQKKIKFVVPLRVTVNLLINIILVYIFILYWTPIWLLFVLSSLGMAFYGNFLKTFIMSLFLAIVLVVSFYLRVVPNLVSPTTKLIEIGQIINYALFIIMVPLLVNTIVKQE
jgi:hypothetical protein